MSPLEKLIVEAVRLLPGVSRQQLPDLIPDYRPGAVMAAASSLSKRGILAVEKSNNHPTRWGSAAHHYTVNDGPKPKPKPLPVVANDNTELEELRAFKKMVLEQHPEMAIPPVIRRARQIVMRHVNDRLRTEVEAGRKDDAPLILAVVDALEEGMAA